MLVTNQLAWLFHLFKASKYFKIVTHFIVNFEVQILPGQLETNSSSLRKGTWSYILYMEANRLHVEI